MKSVGEYGRGEGEDDNRYNPRLDTALVKMRGRETELRWLGGEGRTRWRRADFSFAVSVGQSAFFELIDGFVFCRGKWSFELAGGSINVCVWAMLACWLKCWREFLFQVVVSSRAAASFHLDHRFNLVNVTEQVLFRNSFYRMNDVLKFFRNKWNSCRLLTLQTLDIVEAVY